jgi:hypothetical protein
VLGIVAILAAAGVVRLAWSGSRNLVSNGSFARSLTGWQPWQAEAVRLERGHDDAGAARVVSTATTPGAAVFTLYSFPRLVVDAVPGMTLTAGASVRSAARGRLVCLVVREWQATRVLAESKRCVTGSGRWQRFPSVSHTTRGRGTEIELLVSQSTSGRRDSFVVDDVSLRDG